jgi:hypothetical protein
MAQAVVELFGKPEVPLHIEPAAPGAFLGFPPLAIDKARRAWRFEPRSLAAGLREYRDSLAMDGAHP